MQPKQSNFFKRKQSQSFSKQSRENKTGQWYSLAIFSQTYGWLIDVYHFLVIISILSVARTFFRNVKFYFLQSHNLTIGQQRIAVFKESLSELQKSPLSISLLNPY